ncbi:hypothetical protein ACS0TY_017638 [Phlomoides rotata]
MAKEASLFMLLGVVCVYVRLCFAAASLNTDMSSLLALRSGISSHILASNWSQETSFCTWIGVTCGRRHPRVTALDLSGMGLQGSIAREIGNLSFLTFLDVHNNAISGPIPTEIGHLRRLRLLNMSHNHLSDRIPESIGLLSKLKSLSLSANYLSGDIPASVSACVDLNTLDLSNNSLTGNIPLSFGNLSQLQELNLRGELSSTIFNISSLLSISVGENHMSGTIPKHICSQSSKLQVFSVDRNQFEGEFPSAVIRCHSLEMLDLAGNKLSGNIPSEFWNLSALQTVFLSVNKYTGTIPPSVANLTNLVELNIQDNSFQGKIPSEIGQLSKLNLLVLSLNMLNGEVPQSIFNYSNLGLLSLSHNNLSGSLPVSIDKDLPNLERFYIAHNQFNGKIPTSISNLSKLTLLELSTNSFTGHIPITLGNLPQLQWLSLFGNQFRNNMSMPVQDFLSSLTACKYLQVIQVSDNPITGVLPKSLGSPNLSASLQSINARFCQIRGPLPNEIGNLTNLIFLNLGENHLTGAIPAALGNLRSLQALGIFRNKLQGSISHAICNLGNLFSIDLAENNLFGPLPSCLRNLSSLRDIFFDSNAFNFTIPPTSLFNEHIERIYISNNFLHGSVPGEIGNLKDLIELDLSGNQLSGEIPSSISQLQKLNLLSLSYNNFSGPILESFADLKDLQFLDLSHNHLSGHIPNSLEHLANLIYLNVSFNELSGEIPDEGPFLNFTPEVFAGNRGLCGVPQFKVGACKTSKLTHSSKKKLLKYILPVIASVVVAAIILIFVLRRRARNLPPPIDLPLVVMPERISYYEILRATNNLDDENLIGRGSFGSVYRANFSDAIVAAVKVFNLDVQDALKSFDTECQILRNIRHRNLVKVITSCSNLDFKALVMEHMSNGNLEKCLYSGDCFLNIFQRLGIMIDVASAIEYLHEGYTSPVVHCDLKPNNILLDEDMVAHVGDFGIAKLLTQEQRMLQTRTLGTIGYIAPEYGSEGLVSTMVDVYSYGILLMEVFTKRRPTDEMFSGELTMRRWVSESFPNSVMQIVDRELLNVDGRRSITRHESCLTSIIGLALECTTDLSEERPNIKDVAARMNKIKLNLSNPRS